jgi:lactate dehydrogenase-like 2-hydroxyacid dehydrogenase
LPLPHLGSATERARQAMGRLAAESIADVLAGRTPRHVVG